MKSLLQHLLVLLGLAAAFPVVGVEIMFYEHEGFRGRSYSVDQSISNFGNVGFNDQASSVIVRSGSWQLCTDAYFRGRCVTVARGEYPTLRSVGLDNQISSVRELDWIGGVGGGGAPPGGAGARVELFDGYEFSGRGFVVDGTNANFSDVGFNDQARSMIVHQGTWEACEHADFQGACQAFRPGRYPNLGAFAGRISSIRGGGGGGGPGLSGGAWGTGSRAILYESPNLAGRTYVINNEVASNLAGTGFNDRAKSLGIEAGYWVFCSDAQFGGECLTFGPGDYPTLPRGPELQDFVGPADSRPVSVQPASELAALA